MAGKPFGAANSSCSVSIRQTSSTGSSTSTAIPPGTRILRSPSHESVTTDLSLFSVSSLASDAAALRLAAPRGPSPCPPEATPRSRPADIPEILWFEEENDVMRSCAALSAALGVHKSFSTSDICTAANSNPTCGVEPLGAQPRSAVSELALSAIQRGGYLHPRLEHASRSCSTWVAVGDVASTSQLPSPHGGHAAPPPSAPSALASSSAGGLAPPPATPAPQPPSTPSFTAADLIRSVNKKVRQNYIRRRLLTTYKALERLSQSEFNLDRLEVSASAAAAVVQAEAEASPSTTTTQAATNASTASNCSTVAAASAAGPTTLHIPAKTTSTTSSLITTPAGPLVFDHQTTNAAVLRVVKQRAGKNLPLTIRDVERERGKPLSKYERNMMIFNWLHTLDNSTFEGLQ